jgi:acetate kinase
LDSRRDLNLLTINTGSSSLKMGRYRLGRAETPILVANVDRIGSSKSRISIKDPNNHSLFDREERIPDHGTALRILLGWIERQASTSDIDGIGHRVVLGDRRCIQPQLITESLVCTLKEFAELAPDHVPQLIDTIETVTRIYPNVPQAACFDSSFHSRMPRTSQMYALPRRFFEEGVLRYGFHGLSCEYIMQELIALDPAAGDRRVIVAHLGNGSSVTAVDHGASIDTSMGLTPLSGLVMGTRSGDLDPGALLYLMNRRGMTFRVLNDLLNKESGLLGLSDYSADMRDLIERESTDNRCAEAIAVFCYRVRKFIGAYTAALGGLDTLVFTGGIGEHAAVIRDRICTGLNCIGIALDAGANGSDAAVISAKNSLVKVRVIQTNEDLMIARHTRHVIMNSNVDKVKQ